MHDLGHADEGVEVEEDGERVEDVGEDHPGRLSEHLDLILLRLRVLQQETGKIKPFMRMILVAVKEISGESI